MIESIIHAALVLNDSESPAELFIVFTVFLEKGGLFGTLTCLRDIPSLPRCHQWKEGRLLPRIVVIHALCGTESSSVEVIYLKSRG